TTLTKLENNDQIVLRYCTAEGETDITANPNGSRHHIAGICNRDRNVIGIMPHPERATSQIVGNFDGILFLQWLTQSW
ncbi:MAG: phosphoribosylformylglycinamidine synthase subunit PurQ, partial [Myxococcales bacterium]|nr:phosphoribosylformylglycinamidine synthase subunit PurQ [Myxococcales bacterium]